MSRAQLLLPISPLLLLAGCPEQSAVVARRTSLETPPLLVGPERSTDAPALDALAENSQHSPDLACAAGRCLLVWQDQRRLDGDDIFGARVDASGKVLDPQGLPLNTVSGTQEHPQVAGDGTSFLVVWYDFGRKGVYGTVVDGPGKPLQPDGLLVGAGDEPAVAFDGTSYLVVWRAAGGDIRAARVSSTGAVLDPQGLDVCAAAGAQASPAVSFGKGHYLVTWHDSRSGADQPELYAGRLTPAGVAEDGDGFKVASAVATSTPARVAHDGTNFAVTWSADSPATGVDLFVRRIGPGGALLETAPVALAEESAIQGGADVVFNGQSFVVVWHHETSSASFDIRALRLGSDAKPLDAKSITVAGGPLQEARPALSVLEGNAFIAWDTEATKKGSQDIYLGRLSSAGVPSTGVLVTAAAAAQHGPVVARNQGQQLLAWLQWSKQAGHIYGQHLDAQGGVLEAPQSLSKASGGVWDYAPAIGGGQPALFAWARYDDSQPGLGTDLFQAHVGLKGPAGAVEGLVSVAGEQVAPALAFDGKTTHLAVWEDQRVEGNLGDIYIARVDSDGKLLDGTGVPLAASEDSEGDPTAAFGAGAYLVAWEVIHKDTAKRAEIQLALVSSSGKPEAVQTLPKPNTKPRDAVHPVVAFDGTNFLVVYEWHDHSGFDQTATTWNIYAARVSPQGKVLDPQSIALSAVIGSDDRLNINPDVVFDGSHYLVTWQDEFLTRVEARRLTPAGQRLEAAPVVVSSDPLGQKRPRLGLTPYGRVTIAYERYDATAGSWRVRHRVLSETPAPGPDAGVEAGPPDSGFGEAGAPAADQGGAAPPSNSGCSCRVEVADAGEPPGALILVILLPIALALRRRDALAGTARSDGYRLTPERSTVELWATPRRRRCSAAAVGRSTRQTSLELWRCGRQSHTEVVAGVPTRR